MKIGESTMKVSSQHNYAEMYERRESVSIEEKAVPQEHDHKDRLDLGRGKTPPKRVGLHDYGKRPHQTAETEKSKDAKDIYDDFQGADIKTRIMKMVLEEITGKKISVYRPDEEGEGESDALPTGEEVTPEDGEAPQERQVTFNYELNEIYYERESLAFEATGQVKTEDGREIAFSTSLYQSRELYQENRTSLSVEGALVDPLVINFDGQGVKLSDETVQFDLTNDGNEESIASIANNSAFLALDRNGNGVIDNGSELFGPSTGSGFGELRELDSDNNGWIDENDELFYDLRLWKPGEESSTLLERSVGAISVTSAVGDFQLRNDQQETLGAVREQGIWLNENTGQAGMVQEIDLSA